MAKIDKKLVLASLKSLSRERFKRVCKLKMLRQQKKTLISNEKQLLKDIEGINNKINWELNNQNGTLGR